MSRGDPQLAMKESVANRAPTESVRDGRLRPKGDRNAVLITGGSGFIGRNLSSAFLRAGFRVASVDIAPKDEDARCKLAIEEDDLSRAYPDQLRFEIADVTDDLALERAFAQINPWLVVHAAALTALTGEDERRRFVSTFEVNVAGTAKVVEASRRAGVGRLVLVSSGTVYGTQPAAAALREDAELKPNSTYGISKYMSEMVCRRHQVLWAGQPEIRIARISSPYGDWERVRDSRPGTSEICNWVDRAVRGEPLEVSADGARDFTYVGDAVDGILRIALAAETRHDTYNVASGRLVSFSEVLQEIITLRPAFAGSVIQPGDRRRGEQSRFDRGALCIDRIRDEFGFEAATGLPQGLRRYFDWIAAQS
jgi:nucleoside-diphosphate-sugar epimerase